MNEQHHMPGPPRKTLIMHIWGALPTLAVLAVLAMSIFILLWMIDTKKASIEADKAALMKKEQQDVNVVALAVKPCSIKDKINLPAVVEPWVDLTVLTEVSGKVLKVAVEEGDQVKKGDILATIDERDYQIAYNSAKANYDTAKASLNRIDKLYKDKLTTRTQLDNATAQAQSTRSALEAAALDLERCVITAPISGVINNTHIDEGQYLNHSDPVAQVLQMDRVKVKVGIPESDVEAVRRVENYKIVIDALAKKEFSGTKHFLSRTADARARLYDLSLAVDNKDNEILPDMFARVEIVKDQVQQGLAVPLYSVITRKDKHFVYVVNDNKAHEKEVTMGVQEGWMVEIKIGLSPGDKVIVVGQRSVNDEQNVKLVRTVNDPKELLK